jgi:AcrR family transcriptional regulator
MSLYSYVPDKQTLVYDMVEQVSGEISLPEPSGDWRADTHLLAAEQRALLRRHPWLIEATSHLQPLGPGTLAVLEFALGALEPTGLLAAARLETFALVNGFVIAMVRTELAAAPERAAAPDPAQAAAQLARLQELLATGQYPRFAAALGEGGPVVSDPASADPAAQFDRILDRILDGLIGPADLPAVVPVPAPVPVLAMSAVDDAADDDERDEDRHQDSHDGVAADEAAQHEDGHDHQGYHRDAAGPGGRSAGGSQGGAGAGSQARRGAGRGRRLARQVGEQLGQVAGGAGPQGPAGPLLELAGGNAAGLEVLAQLGDGPVAVGVGYPQAAGLVVLGGSVHDRQSLQRHITTLTKLRTGGRRAISLQVEFGKSTCGWTRVNPRNEQHRMTPQV